MKVRAEWLLTCGAAVLLVSGPALGADGRADTNSAAAVHLTLDQVIEEALRSNPGLKAALEQARAAEKEAGAAGRTRWGVLNAMGSYSYLNDDQIIRPMSRELLANGFAGAPWDRSQVHYGVGYEIPLYLGGRLHSQIQIAGLEAQKSAELLEGTRWQVRFNVVSLYAAVQALDQTGAALEAQVTALAQTKSNLDQMVSLGKRPEVDRLKVIEELEAARAGLAAARADRRRVSALLLAMLGRDPAADVVVEPQTRPDVVQKQDLILPLAVTDNSRVRTARLSAEQAAYGVKVARSDFLPRITANVNAFEHTGTRIDRTEETWGITVLMSMPLFDWGSRRMKLDAARAREVAAREALHQAQLQTEAEWQEALARFNTARTNLEAAAARVTAATEAAHIEQVRYDTGAGTIEDLLRARSREEAARAALAWARADLLTAAERLNTIAEREILR